MFVSHLLNAACHIPAALPAFRADTSGDKATDTCADAQSSSLVRKVPLLECPIMVTVSLQALYLVLLLLIYLFILNLRCMQKRIVTESTSPGCDDASHQAPFSSAPFSAKLQSTKCEMNN